MNNISSDSIIPDNYEKTNRANDVNKLSVSPSKNQELTKTTSASEISEIPLHAQEVQSVDTVPSSGVSLHLFLPEGSTVSYTVYIPCTPRPTEDLTIRKEEHEIATQEQNLLTALNQLSKQARSPQIKKADVLQMTKAVGESVLPLVPVVGPLTESIKKHRSASKYHQQAKAIKREIANPALTPEESKAIGKEIKKLKQERSVLKKGLKELDKAIVKEYEGEASSRIAGRVEARNRVLESIKARDNAIMDARATRCNPSIPKEELKDKLHEMDRLLAQQKKAERKGHGHDLDAAESLTGVVLEGSGQIAQIALGSMVTLTPVTAPLGMGYAVTKGVRDVKNLTKGFSSLDQLKKVKKEALTCEALAGHYHAISLDESKPMKVREASKIDMEIETEKAKLIKDYVRIQKKFMQKKVVVSGVGLASSVVAVGANGCGLLTLIPEPTTSLTMYGLAVGLSGISLGLSLTQFGVDKGATYVATKRKKI